MKLEFQLAFKNLFGARLRTLLNVLVLSFSFVIIIFLNSIMDGWNQQAQKDSIEWEFGEGHLIYEKYDPLDPYTILEGHSKIPLNSNILKNLKNVTTIIWTKKGIILDWKTKSTQNCCRFGKKN